MEDLVLLSLTETGGKGSFVKSGKLSNLIVGGVMIRSVWQKVFKRFLVIALYMWGMFAW